MNLFAILLVFAAAAQAAPATAPATTQSTDESIGAALDALFSPPPGSIEVSPGVAVDVMFGVWDEAKDEKRPGDEKIAELALDDKRFFGVTVLFYQTKDSKGGDITYREVWTLPEKPKSWPDKWGDDDLPRETRPKIHLSDDGRTFTFEHKFHLKPEQVIPSIGSGNKFWILAPYPPTVWQVADGDPVGDWKMEAFVNDKRVCRKTLHVKAK
jgi:hypothetical protein